MLRTCDGQRPSCCSLTYPQTAAEPNMSIVAVEIQLSCMYEYSLCSGDWADHDEVKKPTSWLDQSWALAHGWHRACSLMGHHSLTCLTSRFIKKKFIMHSKMEQFFLYSKRGQKKIYSKRGIVLCQKSNFSDKDGQVSVWKVCCVKRNASRAVAASGFDRRFWLAAATGGAVS